MNITALQYQPIHQFLRINLNNPNVYDNFDDLTFEQVKEIFQLYQVISCSEGNANANSSVVCSSARAAEKVR